MTIKYLQDNIKALQALAKGTNVWAFSANGRWFKIKPSSQIGDRTGTLIIEDAHFEARKAHHFGHKIEAALITYSERSHVKWEVVENPMWSSRHVYRRVNLEWYENTNNLGKAIICPLGVASFSCYIDGQILTNFTHFWEPKKCRLLKEEDIARDSSL